VAANTQLTKFFQNLKGLDLRSSDLLRERGAATDMLNVDLRQTGALNKRKGYQILTQSAGGYGTTDFHNIALTTGVVTEELITVDDDMHVMGDVTFSTTYSGSAVAYCDMYLAEDAGTFFFDVYDDNVRVLNHDLGTGRETSFVSITTLTGLINALTDFSCTGTSSSPAAFIPITLNQTLGTATLTTYRGWTAVDTPSGYTTPFSTHFAAKNDS